MTELIMSGEDWHDYEAYKNTPPAIMKYDGSDSEAILLTKDHVHTATGSCRKDRFGECESTPVADALALQYSFYRHTVNIREDGSLVLEKPIIPRYERQDWSEDTFADQLARGEHQ